jgi:hypothetical protein
VSTLALGGPIITILAVVQAEDGIIIRVFGASRGIPPRARCRGNISRRPDFIKPAELVNDII